MPTTSLGSTIDLEATLEQFRRAQTPGRRVEVARVLARVPPFRDARVLPALVSVLEADPRQGTPLVREHGDFRGGPHLSRSFDSVAGGAAFCSGHRAWMLEVIAEAMAKLGARLSSAQARELARSSYDAAGDPCYEDERRRARAPTPPPLSLVRGPGRNAPCPCGSGKKFKKCCG